jgi:subtilase family serine protease
MRHVRLSFISICGIVGITGALLAASPAGAALPDVASSGGGPVALTADRPAPLPPGTVERGALAGTTQLHLMVTLRVPDQASLTAFLAALSDRRSPDFHDFLRPGQFAARFGAPSSEIRAVTAALRGQGLDPGPVSANGLAIPVTGTATAVDRALGAGLTSYELPGGRSAFANTRAPTIAAAAAPYVQGVLGLSNVYHPQSLVVRPVRPAAVRSHLQAQLHRPGLAEPTSATGPRPCPAAAETGNEQGSYTANQLAAYYEMTPMYAMGDLGQGVHVALAEFEPDSSSDISAYESCYGLSVPVNYIQVDGGAGTGAGSGEAALDIEDLMGLAPKVSIDVYQAPNSGDMAVYDLYSKIVKDDTDQVVSTSWGECELDSDSSLLSAEQPVFEQAATQGQTVFAAAGDDGSTDCFGDPGTTNGSARAVDDPGSQQYVISVGGTSIGSSSEDVWNDSAIANGAGGGGISTTWCMPDYQEQSAIPGLVSGESQSSTQCESTVPLLRQVPDVAADADPQTGYVVYYGGSWNSFGGTSAAAPLWAAVAALIDVSPFCTDYGSGAAGVQPAGLYAMAAAERSYIYGTSSAPEGLYDVTNGNNDYSPSGYTGGLYQATTGYDLASGLGTPLVSGLTPSGASSTYYPGLAALMCERYAKKLQETTITGVSPSQGPAERAETVTITGTGYLPIAGADIVEVSGARLTASCSSTTRCTVRLPKLKAGTATLRMSVEDLAISPVTFQTHYKIVSAPAIKSLSPTSGGRRGRNRLTVRGSNFIGVKSVLFGKKKGTKIRVVSSTEIQVTVPSGSGTVEVTVSAVGGTSKTSKSTRYRYR